jgi:drug/metabolite transporter (DMT)-like permease
MANGRQVDGAAGTGSAEMAMLTPALLALLTMLIWAGNTIVTKASAGVIAPASIAFYRWLIAFVVLTPFVARSVWRHRQEALRKAPQLFVLGMLGMVVYQSLAYEAAKTTTAVNMGVLVALMPLLTAVAGSIFANEQLTRARVAGAFVSLLGVAYLVTRGDPSVLTDGGFHVGDGLILIAVVANTFYGVLLRRWTISLPMWPQLWWQIGFATLVLLPLWLASDISPITATSLPLVLFAALPTSLLAPYCWILAVRGLGAGPSALFINVLPIMVAVLAVPLLGESLHSYHLIGGGLTLFGVLVGLRPARKRDAEARPA